MSLVPPTRPFLDVNATYNPLLAVPKEIRALDSAWKDCARIHVPAQLLAQPTSAAENAKATLSTVTPAHTVKLQKVASTATLETQMVSPTDLTRPTRSQKGSDGPPATGTPAEVPSTETSAAQNRPLQNEPVPSSPIRDPNSIKPSKHNPPAQNTPETKILTNDPLTSDPSSNNQPTDDSTSKSLPADDPPFTILPEDAASFETPLTNEILTRPSLEHSPPTKSTVILPFITVISQVFTTDTANIYGSNSQRLAPGEEIKVSGTPISIPPLRPSPEVTPHSGTSSV